MASYPGTIVTYTVKVPSSTIQSAHINALQDEVVALETGLLSGLQHALWGAQAFRLTGVISPPSIATQQNDYNPAGLSTCSILRQQQGVANVTITGLAAQPGGRLIAIVPFGVGAGGGLTLKNQSASSAAANQFVLPGIVDLFIPVGGFAWLWYDTVNSFWRVISNASSGSVAAAPTFVGARVINPNAVSVATPGTFQVLNFTAADYQVGGTLWAVGNPSVFTVPAGQGGHYMVWTKWNSSTLNVTLKSRFVKNGATLVSAEARGFGGSSQPGSITDTTVLNLAAGDQLQVQATSSVAANIGGTTADVLTEFGFYKLNPT